jgi:hypothetical protein
MIQNQNGLMTLDFMFSFILIGAFSAVLFAVSITLSVTEIAQYIVFASARNYYAGHLALTDQQKEGQAKYAALLQNSSFKPLFSGNWFTLSKTVDLSDHNADYPQPYDEDTDTFVGAQAIFTAPVLKFSVPFLGSTSTNDQTFSTKISAWLMREPTSQECTAFNANRWNLIQALQSKYGQTATSSQNSALVYATVTDNGC